MNEGWFGGIPARIVNRLFGVGVLVVRLELGEGGKDGSGDGFAGLGRVHGDLFLEALG